MRESEEGSTLALLSNCSTPPFKSVGFAEGAPGPWCPQECQTPRRPERPARGPGGLAGATMSRKAGTGPQAGKETGPRLASNVFFRVRTPGALGEPQGETQDDDDDDDDDVGNGMATAWPMATAWQRHGDGTGHGNGAATAWRRHGNGVAEACPRHGIGTATAWHRLRAPKKTPTSKSPDPAAPLPADPAVAASSLAGGKKPRLEQKCN